MISRVIIIFRLNCNQPNLPSFHLLTPAFGLLTAGGGLAALSGPPLAGRMSDITKVELLKILQQIMIVIFRATLESL